MEEKIRNQVQEEFRIEQEKIKQQLEEQIRIKLLADMMVAEKKREKEATPK